MVRHARRRMLAVLHAGRGQHGPRDDLAAVAERQVLVSAIDRHAGHFERHEQLRAKPLRLRHGAPRQLAAADARGKPEIVFDSRAAARLPAGRVPIEQQRPQPFRRAVDRRGEARRAGADDHEVVQLESGRKRSAEALGHLTRLGVAQRGSILEEQRRKLARRRSRPRRAGLASRVPRHIEPAIGDEIAREEVLDLVRPRRPLVPDQPQSLRLGEVLGLPGVEQIVDHREQAFLGWMPTASRDSDRDARR